MTATVSDSTSTPEVREIASGKGWRAEEVICRASAGDRAFEERHDWTSIAVVTQGLFTYRTDQGRALMAPGAMLLGNSGSCFECGHDHGAGDRCIAFHFAPELAEEMAASLAGARTTRFALPAIPPVDTLVPLLAQARVLGQAGDQMRAEQTALDLFGVAFAHDRGTRDATPDARDLTAAAEAAAIIEAHYAEPLSVADLAQATGTTRRRLSIAFRRAIGVTPYHYVLARRLDAAAQRLRTSDETVLAIALDTGFGDLSEFTRRFGARFGCPPAAFRKNVRAATRRT